jgi:hypothetical protein
MMDNALAVDLQGVAKKVIKRGSVAAGCGGRWLAAKRDKEVLAFVNKHHFVTVRQIAKVFFKNVKHREVKARERLRVLHKKGQIQKRTVDGRLVYYEDAWSAKANHWLIIAELYAELIYQARWWQIVAFYEPEFSIDNIVADTFMVVTLTDKGPRQKYFIEVDHDKDIRQPQKKILKLIRLYNEQKWINAPWADLNNENIVRFPRILFITTSEARCKTLREFIHQQGSPLWWKVAMVEDMQKDAWGLLT